MKTDYEKRTDEHEKIYVFLMLLFFTITVIPICLLLFEALINWDESILADLIKQITS